MTRSDLVRYYLAHAAGFGGIALAIGHACLAQWAQVPTDLVAAAAGFGIAISPAILARLRGR